MYHPPPGPPPPPPPGGYPPPPGGGFPPPPGHPVPGGRPARPHKRPVGRYVAGSIVLVTILGLALGLVVLRGGARGCGGEGVTLNVVSSPEKFGVVEQAGADFTGTEVGGECVTVVVHDKSSGAAMSALARGWNAQADGAPQPDVWSPAGSGWVTLLRHRLAGSPRASTVPSETPGIAVSPLVIAMPRPMAQALGWPGRELGWDEILKISRDPKGWGTYGHPEWGEFKLGKTDPQQSTSGLNATVGAYFAATEKSDDLTAGDLEDTDVKSYVRGVESSIVHYGDTTLTFLEGLRRADAKGDGMSYVSAVAVEEMSVWYYNQGNPTGDPKLAGKNPKPKTQLAAIYPKEGTLVSDHPYVTFTTDEVKKRAADRFLEFLRGADVQKSFGEHAFRSYDNRPGPLITEANGMLARQPRKMIAPPAPDVLDRVLRSWESLRKRANVLFVVDVSGSMQEQVPGTGKTRMQLARQSLGTVVDDFVDADRVGLWEFASQLDGRTDHREVAPIAAMDAAQRARLKSRIAGLRPISDTGLYDSTLAAYEHVRANRQDGAINSIVVLTDGRNDDPGGGLSLDALLGKLDGDSGVRIFTVGYGGGADMGALKQIAEATDAGAYNAGDAAAIDKVLADVTSNF